MSIETLTISLNVEEQFDISFNLTDGLLGLILKVLGQ